MPAFESILPSAQAKATPDPATGGKGRDRSQDRQRPGHIMHLVSDRQAVDPPALVPHRRWHRLSWPTTAGGPSDIWRV